MKVAITGHSFGIGKGIFDYFQNKNFGIIGFSRSNGYNIGVEHVRSAIIEQSKDFDIFVNNAYDFTSPQNYQLMLFLDLVKIWKNESKIIINIGSVAGDFISNGKQYNLNKHNLDLVGNDVTLNNSNLHVVNIKPFYTDVVKLSQIKKPKLKVDSIVKIIDFILEFKREAKITNITIYPNLDVDSPSESVYN